MPGTVKLQSFALKESGEVAGSATAAVCPTLGGLVGVIFRAAVSNAGNVYVGPGSGVTKPDGTTDRTTGLELAPGDWTPFLPCKNLNEWYLICDNATDDLLYVAWEE